MGICTVESNFGMFLRQNSSTLARGPMPVEPATELDVWGKYLVCRLERIAQNYQYLWLGQA